MDRSNLHASHRRYTVDIDDKFHPRTVTLVKDKSGFGFTLRHFIVYPPTSFNTRREKHENNDDPSLSLAQYKSDYKNKPMDTIFIREVKEGSPAHNAGLTKGDRILAINNYPLTGKSYSDIIHLILRSGQTLRLLVVPKEDDILQLYFASSAYQPVHREHKQKYHIPSYHANSEQSNLLYKQSSYGTYPGRILHKSKTNFERGTENSKQISKPLFVESTNSHNLIEDSELSNNLHSQKKDYELTAHSDCVFQSGCFSEDESHYNHSKELKTDSLCGFQPPKLKDTVANLYYSLCHNPQSSIFPFSSEENLNYPIYEFDDIIHCDNMEESRSVSEALNMASAENAPNPNEASYQSHMPRYLKSNHSSDRIHDSSFVCVPDSQASNMWRKTKISKSAEISSELTSDLSSNQSSLVYSKSGECSSMPSDFTYSENSDSFSINLVAQRKHQFESGNLLAESMERMNLYRSELSRMSKPNQIKLVSTRAAEFENKSLSSAISPTHNHKQIESDEKDIKAALKARFMQNEQSNPFEYDYLDKQNSNKLSSVETSFISNIDSSISETLSDHSDFPPPGVPSVVHRRKTVPVSSDQDECHIVRRISYLRATANERMIIESDLSEEDDVSDASSPNKEFRIQKLKSFFGEKTPKVKHALHPVDIDDTDGNVNQESIEEPKSVYGWVICKVVSLEGKRSSDRSWRHLWAILRNNILYLLKDRREPSKATITGDEHVINVKYSIAKVASDYIKRKHVLRLMLLNGTEYLVQTESHASMMEWLKALQIFTREISELPEWLKNTSVLEKAAAYEQHIQTNKGKSSSQHHAVKKLVFRHRGPSENSPSVKTRRASQGDELALTKIGILWRDRMVQGWKKVHGTNAQPPKDASFGVKLENAPPGVTNEHVPLIVELCIQIVESRGLDIVGIYRVPGNNASVSVLTDMVNQGIDDIVLQDARWNDVNIVSSLLKAFFRKLPEPLLTSFLYPKFILSSKIDDPVKRLKAIKHVIYHLPVHYFATLRYLMYHLKKVVEHSTSNKMEARNLAIVFGPTLVRTTDNNMVTMVTDMSHQCYLIETMILYAEWLFEDCGDILPLEINAQDKRKTHPPSTIQSNALLSNINKLDDNSLESLPHELLSSFYNTATRHLRHRNKKKDTSSNIKKRSGIIADDTDILLGQNVNNVLETTEKLDADNTELENISDINFGSCSSLISGSCKAKQRSLLKGQKPEEVTETLQAKSPISECESVSVSKTNFDDDIVHHRYNELSAIAQEKIKNFEQETKALLRRDIHKPRASVGTPQVEWEQIEREWQKAKMELEQEDLLDYLADDPSYLSCLLNRGDAITDLSPPNDNCNDDSLHGKSEFQGSISMDFSKDLLSETPSKLQNATHEASLQSSQSDSSVLKRQTHTSVDSSLSEMCHKRSEIDVLTIHSQSLNTGENKTIIEKEYSSTSIASKADASDSETLQPKSESATLHCEPGSETFPCDSTSNTSES